MSWEVLLLRLPLSTTSLAELPSGYVPPPFGRRREDVARDVERTCTLAGRRIEWMGARFGVVRSTDFVLELEFNDASDRILVRLDGSPRALELLDSLCRALGAKAVDCATDRVVDLDDREAASSGLESEQTRREAEVASDRASQQALYAAPPTKPS